jgi:hypothetical protein
MKEQWKGKVAAAEDRTEGQRMTDEHRHNEIELRGRRKPEDRQERYDQSERWNDTLTFPYWRAESSWTRERTDDDKTLEDDERGRVGGCGSVR